MRACATCCCSAPTAPTRFRPPAAPLARCDRATGGGTVQDAAGAALHPAPRPLPVRHPALPRARGRAAGPPAAREDGRQPVLRHPVPDDLGGGTAADLRQGHRRLALASARDPRQGLHRQHRRSHGGQAAPPAEATRRRCTCWPAWASARGCRSWPWCWRRARPPPGCGWRARDPRRLRPSAARPSSSSTTASSKPPIRCCRRRRITRPSTSASPACWWRVLADSEIEEDLFDIVNQFNRAVLLDDRAEAEQVCLFNSAGRPPRQAGCRLCLGRDLFPPGRRPALARGVGQALRGMLRALSRPLRMRLHQ